MDTIIFSLVSETTWQDVYVEKLPAEEMSCELEAICGVSMMVGAGVNVFGKPPLYIT